MSPLDRRTVARLATVLVCISLVPTAPSSSTVSRRGVPGPIPVAALHAGDERWRQPPPADRELPVDLRTFDARVDGRSASSRLQVRVTVGFAVRRRTETLTFWLPPEFPLHSVVDGSGAELEFSRSGSRILVEAGDLEPGEATSWSFRYRWPLDGPLEEVPGVYATTPWYPHLRYEDGVRFPRYPRSPGRIVAELPRGLVAASTGSPSVRDAGERTRYAWVQTRPSALHPLVIGPFQSVERRVGDLTIRGYFLRRHVEGSDRFLTYVGDVLDFYSRTIGAYFSSTFTLAELPLQTGLEGISFPGMTLLSANRVSGDTSFPFRILAHEIAHNWWSFTLDFNDPDDFWLKEGLPTYSAMLYLERNFGREAFRKELRRSRRLALTPERPEPLAAGFYRIAPSDRYALGYHKAAMILHMLRATVGRDAFVDALQELYGESGGGIATEEDFRRVLGTRHGGEVDELIDRWVDDPDVPRLSVQYTVEPAAGNPPSYRLRGVIEQEGEPARVPVVLRVWLQGAPPLDVRVPLDEPSKSFEVECPAPPERLEFDPEGNLLHRGVDVREVPES